MRHCAVAFVYFCCCDFLYRFDTAMDDYTPLSSPTFSLGGSSVASSLGSPRGTGKLRRIASIFSRRERQLALKDVERAIRRANKSHEVAQSQRKQLGETLMLWASQSSDERYQEIASKLHEVLVPLWSLDPGINQQLSDTLGKIDNLKGEEAQRNRLQEEFCIAEKMFYRGKWKGFAAVDLEPLERSIQILRVQADAADVRYRRASSRVLYLALHSFLVQCEEASGARQVACQTALELLRKQNDDFVQLSPFTPQHFDHSHYPESRIETDEDEDRANAKESILEQVMREDNLMCPEYAMPFAN